MCLLESKVSYLRHIRHLEDPSLAQGPCSPQTAPRTRSWDHTGRALDQRDDHPLKPEERQRGQCVCGRLRPRCVPPGSVTTQLPQVLSYPADCLTFAPTDHFFVSEKEWLSLKRGYSRRPNHKNYPQRGFLCYSSKAEINLRKKEATNQQTLPVPLQIFSQDGPSEKKKKETCFIVSPGIFSNGIDNYLWVRPM